MSGTKGIGLLAPGAPLWDIMPPASTNKTGLRLGGATGIYIALLCLVGCENSVHENQSGVTTTPRNFLATALDETSIALSWDASHAQGQPITYVVQRDSVKIISLMGTSHVDTGLVPKTQYTYALIAIGPGGNTSPETTALGETLPSPAGPTIGSTHEVVYEPSCVPGAYEGTTINENASNHLGKYKVDPGDEAYCLTSLGSAVQPFWVDGGVVAPEDIPGEDPAAWSDTESHDYWEKHYHAGSLWAYTYETRLTRPIIEFVAIKNAADGISLIDYDYSMPEDPEADQRFFTIRDVYIQRSGDDAIENDWLSSGLIQRVLIDGASMALGMRARRADEQDLVGAHHNTVVLENSVIRLSPSYATYNGQGRADEEGDPRPSHNGFFKWESDPHLSLGLEMRNNVFVAYHVPHTRTYGIDFNVGGRVDAVRSFGNTLVWLGLSPYPHPLPPWVTCTRNIAAFREARARWFREHPQFDDPFANGEPDPAERFWQKYRAALDYDVVSKLPCSEPLQ